MRVKQIDLSGLREIVQDQIDRARSTDPDPKKAFDPKRAALIVKGADTIINSYKVELASAALLLGNKGKEGGKGEGDDRTTIPAVGRRVDGEAGEEGASAEEVAGKVPGEGQGAGEIEGAEASAKPEGVAESEPREI